MHYLRFLPIFLLVFLFTALTPAQAQGSGNVVVVDADGIVSPGMAAYFARVIAEAEAQQASAVVIELDTPGGLIDSTNEIIKTFRSSSVPIIVYVGPAGAQAGSAGAIITLAGHASAMAPETAIGAASPINGNGADIEGTLYKKIVEFMSAEVRSLTENRSAEAQELAVQMISDAKAVTANEAFAAGLIDLLANDRADLLQQMDGREVLVNGEAVVLKTADVGVVSADMRPLERFQMLLASNTELIGLLLSIGGIAIMIELRAPGGYLAGAIGVIMLGMAFYGMGQNPPNYFGLGLIMVAFILYILETRTPTFGVLTLTGTIALIGGLVLLFDTENAPSFVRISLLSAVGITFPIAVTFGMLAVAMAKMQRLKPQTGKAAMIGVGGEVRKTFKPYGNRYRGTVFAKGELWTAESADPLPSGLPITIDAIDGFTVRVKENVE
ncbi:MAG TPA: nodulation protein NfeD [Anaerolineae bacterium]|nr:nodulation protein NfeD [Anaerolineae bacterium]